MRDRIYFISDVHLGAPRAAAGPHVERLLDFLRAIEERAEALYIVGDLFDFWFEYRWAVPRSGARVLFQLHALVRRGVRVVCLPGNHDIWQGSYLADEVGLELPGGPLAVEHQGRRLYLTHGDELGAGIGFRVSRAVLRSRLSVALFHLLHPDLGALAARSTSALSSSRERLGLGGRDSPRRYRRGAAELLAGGAEMVICGHYHQLARLELAGGLLVILGDWVHKDSYAVLQGGEISVHRWTGELTI